MRPCARAGAAPTRTWSARIARRRTHPARRALATLLLSAAGSCGDGPTEPPPGTTTLTDDQLARVGAIGLSVTLGGTGSGMLDNFIPCVRGGVIDYRDTATGRQARLSGCDVGAGVLVSGEIDLAWPWAPDAFCRPGPTVGRSECSESLDIAGTLRVTVPDGETTLDSMALRAIRFASPPFPEQSHLIAGTTGFSEMRVEAVGREVTVREPLFADVWDGSGLGIDSKAGPDRTPAVLTDDELRRLAYGVGIEFLAFLVDEALESQRGDHGHDLGCGTTRVEYDAGGLPTLHNDWSECDFAGVFVTGSFSLRLAALGPTLELRASGPFTLGGAVATVDLTDLRLTVTGTLPYPTDMTFDLEVRGDGATAGLTETLRIDD